jgi:hypothetical protein
MMKLTASITAHARSAGTATAARGGAEGATEGGGARRGGPSRAACAATAERAVPRAHPAGPQRAQPRGTGATGGNNNSHPCAQAALIASAFGVQVVRGVLRVVLPGRVRGAAVSLLRALQRPALPPTEAAAAFVAAFEQVVDGAERPAFCVSSYREALTAANREHKFLLVYLHAPEHQVRCRFPHSAPHGCLTTAAAPGREPAHGGTRRRAHPDTWPRSRWVGFARVAGDAGFLPPHAVRAGGGGLPARELRGVGRGHPPARRVSVERRAARKHVPVPRRAGQPELARDVSASSRVLCEDRRKPPYPNTEYPQRRGAPSPSY